MARRKKNRYSKTSAIGRAKNAETELHLANERIHKLKKSIRRKDEIIGEMYIMLTKSGHKIPQPRTLKPEQTRAPVNLTAPTQEEIDNMRKMLEDDI